MQELGNTSKYSRKITEFRSSIYSLFQMHELRNNKSAVGIMTGYGLNDPRGRISSPDRFKKFIFSTSSRPALGPTHPTIKSVSGVYSPGVKRPGSDADHTSN
jgi:hypothetical protein